MRTIVIDELTPAEKLDLIGELWDSLDPSDIELSAEQIEELERRIEEADREPGVPWDEMLARIRQRGR
jgi:putative addiction module component (TIGR02574 family)